MAANTPTLSTNLQRGPAKGTPEAILAAKKAVNTNYGLIKPETPLHRATDATITCYPSATNYSTGSCLSTSRTQVSLAMAGDPALLTTERGWMGFDVSGIPAGSVINSVTLYAYCYQAGSYSYWALTRVTLTDPRTSPVGDVYNDLSTYDADGYYLIFYNNPSIGWNSWLLGATAVTDLTNALGGGYYAVGVHDFDEYPSYYYVDFQGWAQTNVPYIIVDYTPPSASDVGCRRIVSPPAGLMPAGLTTVSAMVQNYGTGASGTFPVKMTIGGYTDVQTAPSMVSGDSELITFTSWTATGGVYTAKCSTELTGDGNNLNDFKEISVSVYDFLQDFEADNGGYVNIPEDGWLWGTPTNPNGPATAHSGVNVWGAGLNSNYPSPATWYLYTHAMKATQDNPTVEYYDWWYTEGYWDGYNVAYSTDDGLNWTLIYPTTGYPYSYVVGLSGQPGFSGTQASWLQKQFTIPVLNDQVFKLRFFFGADPSISYYGAYIDDVAGIGCQLFTPAADIGAVKVIMPNGMWAPGEPVSPSILITNYATASQSNFNVRMAVTDVTPGSVAAYDQTVLFTGTIDQGDTVQVDFPEWTNPPAGQFIDTIVTYLVGDENPGNDFKALSLTISDGASGWLAYCDSTTEVGYCWTTAGGEWATKFHAGGGMLLRALRMNCTDYSGSSAWYNGRMIVYEADGPGGAPGTVVLDTAVEMFSEGYPGGHWNEYDISMFGVAVSGDFFLSYYQTQTWPPFMGMDGNAPIDGDDWGNIPGSGWDDSEAGLDASYDNQLEVGYTVYSKDAGIVAINIPPTVIDSGIVVTPQAIVGNFGFLPRTFDAFLQIENGATLSYADTLPGLSWMPFSIQTLDFTKTWTTDPIPGSWNVKAYTDLSPDMNPTNDTLNQPCFVTFRDARTDTIQRPNTSESPGAVPVIIRGRNIGNTQLDSMKIRGIITTPAGDTVYDENRVYYNVAPGTAITSTMGAPWYPGGGSFYASGVTTTLGDMYAVDDIKTKPVYIGEVDCELVSIIKPTTSQDTLPFSPIVKVKNNSTVIMDIPVMVTIYKSGNPVPVYTGTGTALSVGIGASKDETLAVWNISIADTGAYLDTSRVTAGDPNPANDVKARSFTIKGGGFTPPPGPWEALAPILPSPSGKNPKYGSALGYYNGEVYFLKASGKGDFAKWTPSAGKGPGTWTSLTDMPKGIKPNDGKFPKKGAGVVAYTDGLYVLRGNNTPGFWKFAVVPPPETSGWVPKANITTGAKNPKDASGMAIVNVSGTDYIFTMKGSKTSEFYLYDIAANTWLPAIQAPPIGTSGKAGYKKGSCLAYNPGTNDVYILKGQYGDFFKYNLDAQTWTELKRYNHKVYLNRDGKKKKFGDGAAMVYLDGTVYAMKGGNTLEVWKYNVEGDSQDWKQADATWDIPAGAKKVKGGGNMIIGGGTFYATRGANTPDFFGKSPEAPVASTPATPLEFKGAMANPITTNEFKLTFAPNPAINLTAVRYTLPKAGSVSFTLYNVAGTAVKTYTNTNPTTNGVLMVDTKTLPSGVYILRFNSGTISATRKLVLEK
jgi:hypothetical protein